MDVLGGTTPNMAYENKLKMIRGLPRDQEVKF